MLRVSLRRRGGEAPSATRKVVLGVAAAVIAAAVIAGAWFACAKLRALWIEQCVLTDVARQVTIDTGAHIKPGVILSCFGLRAGANLAEIDFVEKRRETLAKIPNIRRLTVERHLPDRVRITVEERDPVARMNVKNNRRSTGRVTDAEGVVFMRQTDTESLPVIVEDPANVTAVGKTLSGRAAAALKLAQLCQTGEFAELGLQAIHTSPSDHLLAVLQTETSAIRVKIAWEGMDEPVSTTDDLMRKTIANLMSAIRTRYGDKAAVWIAMDPNRIYADTKEPIQ